MGPDLKREVSLSRGLLSSVNEQKENSVGSRQVMMAMNFLGGDTFLSNGKSSTKLTHQEAGTRADEELRQKSGEGQRNVQTE